MEGQYTKEGIYYETNKFRKGRPTLVFVHGLSGSISSWDQFRRMQGRYNVLFFDLRGHGKSAHYPDYEDYSLRNFAEDLYLLTREAKIKDFVIVSHSYGCLLALDFLGRYQKLISGAVFLSPDYRIGKTIRGRLTRALLASAQLLRYFPYKSQPGGHIDYAIFPKGDWSLTRILADARNTTFRSYLFCLKQASAFDEEDILPRISVPVLIMHGAKDTIFPASDSIAMASKIKTARLKILPEANHLLILNNTPQVIEEMEKFITGLAK